MRVLKIVSWTFACVGALLLAAAVYLAVSTRTFLAEATRTEGVVIDLHRRAGEDGGSLYAPVVRFTTRTGEVIEFVSNAATSRPSRTRGDRVPVLYRERAPEAARLTGFFDLWGGAVICGGLGLGFFLAGGGMIGWRWRQRRHARWLHAHGVRVSAEFIEVERNMGLSANGVHPYRIVTQWQDPATSRLHVFRSRNLWFDPSAYVPDGTIDVLIERGRPQRYLVDVSFLPASSG